MTRKLVEYGDSRKSFSLGSGVWAGIQSFRYAYPVMGATGTRGPAVNPAINEKLAGCFSPDTENSEH